MFSFNLYCFHFNGVDIYVSRGHKATSWYQHCFFLPHWRCNVAVLSSKYWESEDILKDEEAFFLQRFGGMGIDSNWKIKSGQLLLNFSPRDWADIWAKLFSYLWIFNNLCSIKCLYALNPLSFDEVSRRLFYSCPIDQAPVVKKVDNAIHRINNYPLDIAIGFAMTYPVDSDLSGG